MGFPRGFSNNNENNKTGSRGMRKLVNIAGEMDCSCRGKRTQGQGPSFLFAVICGGVIMFEFYCHLCVGTCSSREYGHFIIILCSDSGKGLHKKENVKSVSFKALQEGVDVMHLHVNF